MYAALHCLCPANISLGYWQSAAADVVVVLTLHQVLVLQLCSQW
jgi:hypothetical protein